MKAVLAALLAVIILGGALAGVYFYNYYESNSASTLSCNDPASISDHVYNPYRLQLVKPCATAAGVVDRILPEQDGDVHIRLNVDPAYASLINAANTDYQYGDLVVEIVCVNTPTQTDAIPACQDYTNPISVPSEGQHIAVTGPYVLDKDHYSWAEIHPVYSLVVGNPHGGVSVSGANLNITYPGESSNGWLGPTPRVYTGWHTVNVSPGEQFTSILSLYSTSSMVQQILSISTSTSGFSIISISPTTPITFDPYATVIVTLTIKATGSNYNGPMDLQITAS